MVSLILAGCSGYREFYIKNWSSKEVWVTIKFQEPWRAVIARERRLQLLYVDSLVKIGRNTNKYLTKKLPYREVNAHKLYIVIPPRSTLLVGADFNKLMDADSIRINHDGDRKDYWFPALADSLKRDRSIFRSAKFTFNIKGT